MANPRSLLICLSVAIAAPAAAFMPTKQFDLMGFMGYSHSQITHDALRDLTREIYGEYQTHMMHQSRREIAHANAEVDHDFHTSQKHFDGESLPEGQQRIFMLRTQAVDLLKLGDVKGARSLLGQCTHTLQDFYSHSNWIENGNHQPHPEIARPFIIPRLPADFATCQQCEKIEHKLFSKAHCPDCDRNLLITPEMGYVTTGYYSSETRIKPGPWKCSHGGEFDKSTSVREGGINKDTVKCHMSPHWKLHWTAINVARQATRQFFLDLFKELTADQTAALLGALPKTAIAYDDPNADKGGAIRLAKQNGFTNLKKRGSGKFEIPNFLFISTPISSINSPSDIVTTTDPDAFEKAINSASTSRMAKRNPDGDGMTLVIDRLASGSHFMLFRDPTHAGMMDEAHATRLANQAASRNIRIYPISEKPTAADDILAQITGGIKILPKFLTLLARSLKTDSVTIFSSNKAGKYSVPIDSTVTNLIFVGDVESIIKPDGSAADPDEAFTTPQDGMWTVTSSGSVSVLGSSPLRIDEFEVTQYAGRPGHMGYYPVQSLLSGVHYTAVANVVGDISNPIFSLGNMGLEMLKAENLTEVYANVTVPAGEHTLTMTGKDSKGLKVQRQWTVPVVSTEHVVSIHGMVLVDGSNVATANVLVQGNSEGKATLELSVSNPAYKIVGPTRRSVVVHPGHVVEVPVKVQLPKASSGSAVLGASLTFGGETVVGSRLLPLEEFGVAAASRIPMSKITILP